MDEKLLRVNRRKFLARSASWIALGAAALVLPKAHAEDPKAPEDPMRVPGALPRPYGERSPFIKSARVGGAGPGAPHGCRPPGERFPKVHQEACEMGGQGQVGV